MGFESALNKIYHRISRAFRKRRRQQFLSIFPPEKFRSMVDIDGLVEHWTDDPRDITVLNLTPQTATGCKVMVGDARNAGLADSSFDLAYSNSVIEHVGEWPDQVALAAELRRIGKAVYCQTPNRWFPVEVHYLTLFLHWYPGLLRNYWIARFFTGWGWLVSPDHTRVQQYYDSVRLLSFSQVKKLFPDCDIQKEKFLGMTKSLIAVRLAPSPASPTSAG